MIVTFPAVVVSACVVYLSWPLGSAAIARGWAPPDPAAGAALDDAEDVVADELEAGAELVVAGAAVVLLVVELLELELPQPAIASITADRVRSAKRLRK